MTTTVVPSGPSFLALDGAGSGVDSRTTLTVVLLPGLGGNALTFPTQFLDALGAALDAGLVLSVTYGFPFGPTMDLVADQVWAALRGLPLVSADRAPLPRWVLLVGYSMGGFVAQTMAARVPEGITLAGVVLLSSAVPSPTGLPVPWAELWQSVAAKPPLTVMERLQGLFPAEWFRGTTEPTLRSLAGILDAAHVTKAARSQQLAVLLQFLFTDGVARLKNAHSRHPLRVLALHGTQDRVLDVGALQATLGRVMASTPSLNIAVRLFPGAGHGLVYQDTAAVVAAIHSWWWSDADPEPPTVPLLMDPPPAGPTLLPGLFWL